MASLGEINNHVGWNWGFYLWDDDVGASEAIDLSAAVITITIRDDQRCEVLKGSSSTGDIVISTDPGWFYFNFDHTRLNHLNGTYDVGMRLRVTPDDEPEEFFRGTINIYDGIDRQ